jgi:outer membrane protein assembly factor BamB
MNCPSSASTFRKAAARLLCAVGLLAGWARAADQPQWGQRYTRNMVSAETGLVDSFDIAAGRNVRWSCRLGTDTYSTPVVAGGRVLIGTNNARPRDPQHGGDCGVLMCLDEKDGRLCWQLVVPKLGGSPYRDWPRTGLVSPCTVEGDRVYLVSNRNEVMCLDLAGLGNGNDGPYQDESAHMGLGGSGPQPLNPTDADVLWLFDIDRELGVHQHDAAHSSILIHGNHLYLCTSNGVDDDHLRIPSPNAPSLIVLDKATGRLVARDEEHMAPRTIHCTWSSPAIGDVSGRPLVLFGGGDGVCYGFETAAPPVPGGLQVLRKSWWFDCDPSAPREQVHRYQDNRHEGPSNIYGMPVFHKDRAYVAAGGDFWHGKRESWLKCIDPTGRGDITTSGQVWSYALQEYCMATPAVYDDLVFIADCKGRVHCVDSGTGQLQWIQETKGEIWSSTLVADGKVYAANRRGELWIFAASRTCKVLNAVRLDDPIHGTPMAANGTLYVATMTHLYALGRAIRG